MIAAVVKRRSSQRRSGRTPPVQMAAVAAAGSMPFSLSNPDWVTATATVVLAVGAIVTSAFAIMAFRKQTREVGLLEQQQMASIQPLLVPAVERPTISRDLVAGDDARIRVQIGSEAKIWRSASDYWAVVPIRNVGNGPALFDDRPLIGNDELGSVIITDRFGGFSASGRVTSRVVAPNDTVDVVFHQAADTGSTPGLAARPDGHPLVAEVRLWYRDLSGQMTHTSISYEDGDDTVVQPFDVRVVLAKKLASQLKSIKRFLPK